MQIRFDLHQMRPVSSGCAGRREEGSPLIFCNQYLKCKKLFAALYCVMAALFCLCTLITPPDSQFRHTVVSEIPIGFITVSRTLPTGI